MQFDIIIVGLGLSGSLLSRRLLAGGCSVLAIDDNNTQSASKIAGGVINPVTGKRMVTTWMADHLLPFAYNEYSEIASEYNTHIVAQKDIIEFFSSTDEIQLFEEKVASGNPYLISQFDKEGLSTAFDKGAGLGKITGGMTVSISDFLWLHRNKLHSDNRLLEEKFDFDQLTISNKQIRYKDFTAKHIIFAQGVADMYNPFFATLPWSDDKGEALIVEIPNLDDSQLYKKGITIVPLKNSLFWVGASHDWEPTNIGISEKFKTETVDRLNAWLKLPFKIIDHIAAYRPANFDRKPFVGLLAKMPTIGILNGMGGKGFSLAPYFAAQLANLLLRDEPILPDADINRYAKVLENVSFR